MPNKNKMKRRLRKTTKRRFKALLKEQREVEWLRFWNKFAKEKL